MFPVSVNKVDKFLHELEEELKVYTPVDPDDPWGKLFKSPSIQKKICSCGFRLTMPFEDICPLCGFKDKSQYGTKLPLLPIDQILSTLNQKMKGKESDNTQSKPSKQEAPKKEQQKKEQQPKADAKGKKDGKKEETIEDKFGKTEIRVCKVTSIAPHPSADKLFVCDLEIGNGAHRQVCAGLVGSYKAEELNGRVIIAILNLKPRKLKGVESAAMVLAADNTQNNTAKVLVPPPNSQLGDRITLQGVTAGAPDKTLSGNVWTELVPLLKVVGGKATMDGKVMVTDKGEVTVPELPDGAPIH